MKLSFNLFRKTTTISLKTAAVLTLVLNSCNSPSSYDHDLKADSLITLAPLKVSADQHFLEQANGEPFFYFADTGWELFHRLNRNEAAIYVKNRKEKGFNVIQAVLLAENGTFNDPNAYHDAPLVLADAAPKPLITTGNDPNDSLAYDYWDHADYILNLVEQEGLFVGLLPCWGEYVTPRFNQQGVFKNTNEAYEYGYFLGNRYRTKKNIIWILGGDRLPNETIDGISIWRAMAEGITDGVTNNKLHDNQADYQATFMTYHCFYPSSIWFEQDDWIDFHMWGSYHEKRNNDRAFEIPYYQWNLKNLKPTINSEPAYEFGHINYDREGRFGEFDDFDVRQQAYWSVFAGAAGHTYGASAIWSFYNPRYSQNSKKIFTWMDQLDAPGATQLVHLKNLMTHPDIQSRLPAQDMLLANTHDETGHLQAIRSDHRAYVYAPTGKDFGIKLGVLHGFKINSYWYNPRDGKQSLIGQTHNEGHLSLDPPGEPERGNDWVLILESIH